MTGAVEAVINIPCDASDVSPKAENFLATQPRQSYREKPIPVFTIFFVYALYKAAAHCNMSLLQPWFQVTIVLLATIIAATPHARGLVDRSVDEAKLRNFIKYCYCSEWIGLGVIGVGVLLANSFAVLGSFIQMFGVLLAAEFTQLFRVQRMTTGMKATTYYRLVVNTVGSFGHHFASCLCMPNTPTVIFVTAWRSVSIFSHCIRHLPSFGFSTEFMHLMSWTRFVVCVCVAQPLVIACLAGRLLGYIPASHLLGQLADGLVANAAGHLYYLIYRGHRLVDQRKNPPEFTQFIDLEICLMAIDIAVLVAAATVDMPSARIWHGLIWWART